MVQSPCWDGMQSTWKAAGAPRCRVLGGRRCSPCPSQHSPPTHGTPPCWRKPRPQAASCPWGEWCHSGGVTYCKPGVLWPPSPINGVLRLGQPYSPHLSPFSLQTPGAQRHQVHPPRCLLPLQEAAEDVSVQPQHPSPCWPAAPHSNGHGALAMTWLPHMAALGWGLGYAQLCVSEAGGGPLDTAGGWGHGAREEGTRPPSPFWFQRPEQQPDLGDCPRRLPGAALTELPVSAHTGVCGVDGRSP